MEVAEKTGSTVKRTNINDLPVCISFYILCSVVLFLVSRNFPFNRTEEVEKYSCLASSMFPDHFIPLDRIVPLYKEVNSSKKVLKPSLQVTDEEIKKQKTDISSFSLIKARRKEIRQLIENSRTDKVVPASESRTNINPITTIQQTRCDKFSDTVPKAFAPP
jgi:hypothetical protein